MNSRNPDRFPDRISAVRKAQDSFRVLFESVRACGEKRRIVSDRNRDFLQAVHLFLRLEQGALSDQEQNRNCSLPDDGMPDSADALNLIALCCGRNSLSTLLDEVLLEALNRLNSTVTNQKRILKEASDRSTMLNWTLRHAMQFAASLQEVLTSCPLLEESRTEKQKVHPETLSLLTPEAGKLTIRNSRFLRSTLQALAMDLAKEAQENDPFARHRFFRYKEEKLLPVETVRMPAVKDFFGYSEAKDLFREHFSAFQAGTHNLPLLLDGLPGLGKTKMTIAFALEMTDAVLVLPGQEALQEGLEGLIGELSKYPERKFIVFFDDVEVSKIDFYFFRTYVGGSFALPQHIMTVLASNYKFPPNVASRGRTFTFPLFDEIRCQEMIEDFLLSRKMKNVSNELLSVIASDYVESYGQKVYDELSPRSLSRYLTVYLLDREKRTRMVDFSRGEVITRPDPEAFYAQNIKLLRSLYGKEVLEEIREQELSGKG